MMLFIPFAMQSLFCNFTQKTRILLMLWLDVIISITILSVKVSQKYDDSCYLEQTLVLLCRIVNFNSTVSFLLANIVISFVSVYSVGQNKNNVLIPFIANKIICVMILVMTIVFWYYNATPGFLQINYFIAGIITVFQLYSIFMAWIYLKITRKALSVYKSQKKFKSVATIWIGDTCNLISSSNNSSLMIESVP